MNHRIACQVVFAAGMALAMPMSGYAVEPADESDATATATLESLRPRSLAASICFRSIPEWAWHLFDAGASELLADLTAYEREREFRHAVEELDGYVGFDYEVRFAGLQGMSIRGVGPPGPLLFILLQRSVGLGRIRIVDFDHLPVFLSLGWRPHPKLSDDQVLQLFRHAEELRSVQRLSLAFTGASGAVLPTLARLPNLSHLEMGGGDVGNDHLAALRECKSLTLLNFVHTRVSDDGLAHLASIAGLQYLALNATDVTDRGLQHLQDVRALRTLIVFDTKVTQEGVDSLQRHVPGLTIRF